MSIINSFSKKILITMIIITIMLSIIFNSIIIYFIKDFKNYAIQINDEEISPKIIQLLYFLNKKYNNHHINNNLKICKPTLHEELLYKKTLMQIIYTTLLKQYLKKLHFHVIKKNIKNKIYQSKFFQKENKFNLNQYLNFINFIELTNEQYITSLEKKETVKDFIYLLLKSEIFLKDYFYKIMKKSLEKRNVQLGYFDVSLTNAEKKILFQDIKKYYILNKKKFFYPKRIKFKILKLQNQIPLNQKNNQIFNTNNTTNNIIDCEKEYKIFKMKNIKYAQLLFHNIQHDNKGHQNIKKRLLEMKKEYEIKNMDWIHTNHLTDVIKKFKIKNVGDVSNIIEYHDEFLIAQLTKNPVNSSENIDSKKNKMQNNCDIFNNTTKNIKNISTVLKKYTLQPKTNDKNIFLKEIKTDWIKKDQKLNFHYIHPLMRFIQKNFFNQKKSKNINPIKIFISKDNTLYIIKPVLYQPKKIKKLNCVINEIKHILQQKKIQLKNSNLIKKFLSNSKNISNNFLKNHKLCLQPTKTIKFNEKTKKNNHKIIFQLPIPKKNNFIYTIIHTKNNQDRLLILKNVFYENINKKQKIKLLKKIKKKYKNLIFSIFLKNIYQNSIIKYQKKILNIIH
ncbi:SurA N-terminal domain-containing protein [Buchnera aphidicola]|uniref:SurA N-terminal domain-containing protein n=1 Tax=Buchnera aphidicola TaxID=9 RepID=UPI00094D3131|nr:SurA N-terminal domain-containing protein [Buchnera aphidicola]